MIRHRIQVGLMLRSLGCDYVLCLSAPAPQSQTARPNLVQFDVWMESVQGPACHYQRIGALRAGSK
jgi:hypothetical protein